MIPLSMPVISGNEWKYVKECLDTGWVSSVGSFVEHFEKMTSTYVGTKYSVAIVNGTSALHLSLLECDVENNDEVIVPTLTFIAPVNAVRYCGAIPVFMDCDDTLCLDIDKLINFLKRECFQKKDGFTYNKKSKRRIKAVIPVHIFGHPVNMHPLIRIAKKYNLSVIEDATESIGSDYYGKKTGSFSDVACFSFNGNKIITTGSGGMITTNKEKLAKKIRHLSTQAKCHPIEYDHDFVGYNYRLTNVLAAIGVAQMEKLNKYIKIKRNNSRLYQKLFSKLSNVSFLTEKPWAKSNMWFYTLKVHSKHKNPLLNYLLSRKIQVRPIWKLIHTLKIYKNFQAYYIEKATDAYKTCINLPCSVNLTKTNISDVFKNVERYFNNHAK